MFICKCRLEETKLEEQKIVDDRHLLELQLQHEVDKIEVMILLLLSLSANYRRKLTTFRSWYVCHCRIMKSLFQCYTS